MADGSVDKTDSFQAVEKACIADVWKAVLLAVLMDEKEGKTKEFCSAGWMASAKAICLAAM